MSGAELTSRYKDALTFAFDLHRDQKRKYTCVSYFSHLMAVSSLVLEDGGDEDEAIAALLHDAAEDRGGKRILKRIRECFGERVASIVEGCSDSLVDVEIESKPPWLERKQAYLAHLRQAPVDISRISLADKLHNARTIVHDVQTSGDALWGYFRGGKEGTLWYYRELVCIFEKKRGADPMVIELRRLVDQMTTMGKSNTLPDAGKKGSQGEGSQ